MCEADGQIAHEGGRSAHVEVGIARHVQLAKHTHVQASGSVEIQAWAILGIGRAVANVAVAVGQGFEEGTRLLGKSMLAAIAGSMEPPDFPRRRRGRQRVEHRQYGGRSDAGTQENDGGVARPKGEAPRAALASTTSPTCSLSSM